MALQVLFSVALSHVDAFPHVAQRGVPPKCCASPNHRSLSVRFAAIKTTLLASHSQRSGRRVVVRRGRVGAAHGAGALPRPAAGADWRWRCVGLCSVALFVVAHSHTSVLQQELALDLNAVLPGAPPALVDIVRATQQYEPQFRPSFAELREQLETQSSTV